MCEGVKVGVVWGMSQMEKSLCEEVSGTEICPELGNVMIESLWRKDQDDVGKMTRVQDFRILGFI